MIEDRRKDERIALQAFILYRQLDATQFLPAKLKDISLHGLFVWVEHELSFGESIELVVAPLLDDYEAMKVVAEVVRIEERREDECYGYGCIIKSSEIVNAVSM